MSPVSKPSSSRTSLECCLASWEVSGAIVSYLHILKSGRDGRGITGIVEVGLVSTDDIAQVLLIVNGVHFGL